jgi:hypothetical protein
VKSKILPFVPNVQPHVAFNYASGSNDTGHLVLKIAIDFRAMLDSIKAHQLFAGIIPVKDAIIAYSQFAESAQFIRHSYEPPMQHVRGML